VSALRKLIEQASSYAEDVFDPEQTMMMRHICEKADGGMAMIVCPVGSVEEEVLFRERLPQTFPSQFVRWVFVSEAWSADMAGEADTLPSKHPLRIEIVAFVATEGATGERLVAHRQIYRPAIGGGRLLPLIFERRETRFMMEK
jgi:hypothetical protein